MRNTINFVKVKVQVRSASRNEEFNALLMREGGLEFWEEEDNR